MSVDLLDESIADWKAVRHSIHGDEVVAAGDELAERLAVCEEDREAWMERAGVMAPRVQGPPDALVRRAVMARARREAANEDLQRAIRALREVGWTWQRIADAIGMPAMTVWNYGRERRAAGGEG